MNKLELAKKPKTLAELAEDENCIVRSNAARNPNTPAETMAELANDRDWYVRSYAARNPQYAKKTIKRKNI